MSLEIVAQPGLTNVECQVLVQALNFFRDQLRETAARNPDPENPGNVAHAVKIEQYCHVADSVIGKVSRSAVKLGKVPGARNITPGSGRIVRGEN